jgi:hypothetical protein
MNDRTLPLTGQFSPAWVDFFILLGAILLVTLSLLIWVLVFHKKRRRHQRHHRHHAGHREEFQKSAGGIKELIQPHQHYRRREHRPINPTLAETGGLPPLRGEKPPPPPQP